MSGFSIGYPERDIFIHKTFQSINNCILCNKFQLSNCITVIQINTRIYLYRKFKTSKLIILVAYFHHYPPKLVLMLRKLIGFVVTDATRCADFSMVDSNVVAMSALVVFGISCQDSVLDSVNSLSLVSMTACKIRPS